MAESDGVEYSSVQKSPNRARTSSLIGLITRAICASRDFDSLSTLMHSNGCESDVE